MAKPCVFARFALQASGQKRLLSIGSRLSLNARGSFCTFSTKSGVQKSTCRDMWKSGKPVPLHISTWGPNGRLPFRISKVGVRSRRRSALLLLASICSANNRQSNTRNSAFFATFHLRSRLLSRAAAGLDGNLPLPNWGAPRGRVELRRRKLRRTPLARYSA